MEHEEVNHRTVRSIIALIGRTILLQLITAGAFFLLGVFLAPSAIGIFIVVSSVMRIFTLFTDVGLGAALVQKKEEVTREDLVVAFSMQETLVVGIVVLGLLLSAVVQAILHLNADGVFLYQVLIFSLFISSLKVIPSILLERKLAFEKQVIPQIVESVVFNTIVVFLAFKGWGVASYSWAVLLSSLAGLPIYYLLSPWPIGFSFSFLRGTKLLSYGIAYQGKTILAVVKDDLLTLFLSQLVGSSGIGYWGWAQRWAYSPYRFVVDSVTKVTFPAYSRFQEHKDILGKTLEKTLYLVSAVLFPALVILSIAIHGGTVLVDRLTKWQPALWSFYFLCMQSALAALTNIMINILDSTGRVKTTLGFMVMWIVLTWAGTIYFVKLYGFTGIAIGQLLVGLTLFIVIPVVQRYVAFRFWHSVRMPLLCTAMMVSLAFLLTRVLPLNWATMALTAGTSGLAYAALFWLLDQEEVESAFRSLRKIYAKKLI